MVETFLILLDTQLEWKLNGEMVINLKKNNVHGAFRLKSNFKVRSHHLFSSIAQEGMVL